MNLQNEDLRPLPLLERGKDDCANRLAGAGDHGCSIWITLSETDPDYSKACELDLEGVVAKWKAGAYIASDRRSSWVKIKNRNYSQLEGRGELFERI